MNTLAEFTAKVTELLDLHDAVDEQAATKVVLDLARDVAHGVARPAAPVTAFLLGLAVARTGDPVGSLAETARRVAALAEEWEGSDPSQ